jgi:hypothetical protein
MKKLIKLFAFSLLLVCFTGCNEELERTVFDGDGTFVSFLSSNATSLAVSIDDASATIDLSISASGLSGVDRTYPLVLNTDNTTADLSTFALPASVTIPAGSYFGTFTLSIINNDLLDSSPKNIVFGLEEDGSFDIDNNSASVTVFEVCPVPDDFMVGEYEITEISSTSASFNGTVAFATGTVTITAPTETTRFFEIPMWPAFRPDPRPVTFTLVCNTLVMEETGPDNILCTAGVPTIYVDSGNNTYDTSDDSFFEITYLEDFDGSCGGPFNASFSLTKL